MRKRNKKPVIVSIDQYFETDDAILRATHKLLKFQAEEKARKRGAK